MEHLFQTTSAQLTRSTYVRFSACWSAVVHSSPDRFISAFLTDITTVYKAIGSELHSLSAYQLDEKKKTNSNKSTGLSATARLNWQLYKAPTVASPRLKFQNCVNTLISLRKCKGCSTLKQNRTLYLAGNDQSQVLLK